MLSLWVTVIILGVGNLCCLYFLWKFSKIILDVEDSLEDSLEILDETYGKLGEILQLPLFHDSPEVRMVITQIGKSRDSILYIANRISSMNE
jgi:hypothetical protein